MYIRAADLTDVIDEMTLRQLSNDNSRAQALKDLERIADGKLHLGLKELGSESDDNLPSALKFKAKAPKKIDLSGY